MTQIRLLKNAKLSSCELWHAARRFATSLGRTRSDHHLTVRLDEVYTEIDSSVDPVLYELQLRSLPREDW